jgi:hypothetical protein
MESSSDLVRILFSVRNPSYVRHYDSVLRLLASHGHEVLLVTERSDRHPWPPSVLDLVAAYPHITLSTMPERSGDPWFELATRFRQARFYLRFLEADYQGMPALLARTRSRAPRPAIRLAETLPIGAAGRHLLARVLGALERATGTSAPFHAYLASLNPDVVVLTPLVVLKTSQLDLARAAIERGVRNVFAVASWDNLSSKGELTFAPQRVVVWNEVQKQEAVLMHGMPADRIEVTGAQLFDEWFDKTPATSRDAFCARVGLRPDRPIVLFVCSALLEGSDAETGFVLRWLRSLRGSPHAALRECGVLIRPHFKRWEEWREVSFAGLGDVVCWPPAGAVPVDAVSKSDYYDSMFHAAAVVGLNTSAMIEAAIVGRPVHTVLLPEFHDNQEGTVHFHYLLHGPHPLLYSARSLEQHADDLAATLADPSARAARSAAFVRSFVRPGSDPQPATARFVSFLETLMAAPAPAPAPAPWWAAALRPLLAPFAQAAAARVRRIRDEHRRAKERRLAEHRRARSDARTRAKR